MAIVIGQQILKTKTFLYSLLLSTAFFSSYILWVIIVLKSIKEFLGKHFSQTRHLQDCQNCHNTELNINYLS